MLQTPPRKNLVLEIEALLGTLEVSIVFKLRTSFEHLAVDFWSFSILCTQQKFLELEIVQR
jgi:hypothetical protein